MAGASFNLNWAGLDRMVTPIAIKGAQSQAVMEEIGEALVASTVERFDSSTTPDGTAWKPSQRAEKEGGKTLVKTGRLRSSIGFEASTAQVIVGTNVVYGRIHQLGGKTGRGHAVTMPARPYLGFSEEDMEEARAIIAEHVVVMLGGRK